MAGENDSKRRDVAWIFEGIEEMRRSGMSFENPPPPPDPGAPTTEELFELAEEAIRKLGDAVRQQDAA